jgi:hypothetical protein
LKQLKTYVDGGGIETPLVFADESGQQVDFDLRGSLEEVLVRARGPRKSSGPGRPKLGVVSREISLLPRHWEWLQKQPQGISAALRRLVDEARKRDPSGQKARQVRDALSRVMWSMGGNLPGFEEASRALFAKRYADLRALIRQWPEDLREYVEQRLELAARLESERGCLASKSAG